MFIHLLDPPTIDHHSNINQRINETDSLSLTCTADGYPEPTITWTKSPGTITQPNIGNVYTILSVNRSDTGTYKCTASNGILSDAMTSIQVTVQCKLIVFSAFTYVIDNFPRTYIEQNLHRPKEQPKLYISAEGLVKISFRYEDMSDRLCS